MHYFLKIELVFKQNNGFYLYSNVLYREQNLMEFKVIER